MELASSSQPPIPFELSALANAVRYQQWLRDMVLPFLGQRIFELGSGIGNLSQHLPVRERLLLSDVEENLLRILEARFSEQRNTAVIRTSPGEPLEKTLAHEQLDTVVSFNVLEHVEDDAALMRSLLALLQASNAQGPKRIVSVVPAHSWAYGPVDREFGHFRRYSASSFRLLLQKAGARDPESCHLRYFNLPALFGWWWNGKIRGNSSIGEGNMRAFELLCPLIRPLDGLLCGTLGLPLGNSLLAVYEVKNA